MPTCTIFRRNASLRNAYSPPDSLDTEDSDGNIISESWRSEISPSEALAPIQNTPRRSTDDAKEMCYKFHEYFVSDEGSVLWQNSII